MKENHVDPRRLAWMIADPDRLDPGETRHIAQCPQCRARVHELEEDLARLSLAARRHVPDVTVRVRLPATATRPRVRDRFNLPVLASAPALALAAALVLVLTVVFRPVGPGLQDVNTVAPALSAYAPDPEMAEALSLADADLPGEYLDMVDITDGDSFQEFFEFAAPLPEEDLTGGRLKKGGFPC
ncbi:MAG: hypothetical protein KKA60_02645 [Proteobacteria bacterium]|nr:hypothetical protein [Pseudomonadota bacterium]